MTMCEIGICKHNFHVDCPIKDRSCDSCGWNPEVNAQRVAKMKEMENMKDADD